MNIEASISNVATPGSDDASSVPSFVTDIIKNPTKSFIGGTELKRATLTEANAATLVTIHKKGFLVFEEGSLMKTGQGRWIKVYYEEVDKNKWRTQIACLGEFFVSGAVTQLSGPTYFMLNGVQISLIDYYKSL